MCMTTTRPLTSFSMKRKFKLFYLLKLNLWPLNEIMSNLVVSTDLILGSREALHCSINEIPQMDINTGNNNLTNPNMEQMIYDNMV